MIQVVFAPPGFSGIGSLAESLPKIASGVRNIINPDFEFQQQMDQVLATNPELIESLAILHSGDSSLTANLGLSKEQQNLVKTFAESDLFRRRQEKALEGEQPKVSIGPRGAQVSDIPLAELATTLDEGTLNQLSEVNELFGEQPSFTFMGLDIPNTPEGRKDLFRLMRESADIDADAFVRRARATGGLPFTPEMIEGAAARAGAITGATESARAAVRGEEVEESNIPAFYQEYKGTVTEAVNELNNMNFWQRGNALHNPWNDFSVKYIGPIQTSKPVLVGAARTMFDSGRMSNQDRRRIEQAFGSLSSIRAWAQPDFILSQLKVVDTLFEKAFNTKPGTFDNDESEYQSRYEDNPF